MSAKAAVRATAVQYARPSRPTPPTPSTKRRSLVVVTPREQRVTEEDEHRIARKRLSGLQITLINMLVEAGDDGLDYEIWFPMLGNTRRSMFTNSFATISKKDLTMRITPFGRFMASLLNNPDRIFKKSREVDNDRFNAYLSTVKSLNAFSR